jgi:hypothetical protein
MDDVMIAEYFLPPAFDVLYVVEASRFRYKMTFDGHVADLGSGIRCPFDFWILDRI